MNDGFAAIGRPDPHLQRLKDLTGPFGDQVHGNLTSEAADGFPYRDRSQGPVGLTKSHDRGPQTNGRTSSGTSPLSKRLTTSERSRRSKSEEAGAHRIANMRRAETGPPRTRGRRERQESLANLIHIGRRSRPQRDPAKSVHLRTVLGGGPGVKEAERSDNVFRGSDQGILQERRTSTTAPSWIRVFTLATTEAGRTSESSTGDGGARSLLDRTGEGAHRSALMPLSQSRQQRRTSPSCLRTCFLPPREEAGRTSAGRVRRSVQLEPHQPRQQ